MNERRELNDKELSFFVETTVKSRLATCIDHCRMMLRIQAVAACVYPIVITLLIMLLSGRPVVAALCLLLLLTVSGFSVLPMVLRDELGMIALVLDGFLMIEAVKYLYITGGAAYGILTAVAALPMVFFLVKIKDKMLAIAGFIHELRNYHFGKEEVSGLKKHGYYYYAPVGFLIKEEHGDMPKRISEDVEDEG